MADIFVSYNRVDSDYAVLLHAWLAETFGQGRVFWDRDGIEPGANFQQFLSRELRECRALVALIGPGWKPSEWICRELAAALRRKVLVLPLLIGGRAALRADELPTAIRRLHSVQALEAKDLRFRERLVEHLAKAIPARSRKSLDSSRRNARATRLGPLLVDYVSVLQSRAFALMDAGNPHQAAADLNDGLSLLMILLEQASADDTLLSLLGYVYKDLANAFNSAGDDAQCRRYAELALSTFHRVLENAKEKNDRASALNGLGNAFALLGDYRQAIENCEKAVALAPDYAYAWRDLVQLYDEQASGRLDLTAMRKAVRQLRATASGVPNLSEREIRHAEARLRYWERREGPAARSSGKSAGRRARADRKL